MTFATKIAALDFRDKRSAKLETIFNKKCPNAKYYELTAVELAETLENIKTYVLRMPTSFRYFF